MWPFKSKQLTPQPDTEIEYRMWFVCKNNHIQGQQKPNTEVWSVRGIEQICSDCGELATAAVFKETYEPARYKGDWKLYLKPEYSFVRHIEPEDPMKLTDDAFTKIKSYAAKKFVGTPTPEEQDVYQQGLKDGTTAFSRWLLEQITGEEQDA